ncbi:MAG: hypothetical protein SLRJCFUN_002513, partial [Candidatus Fervidibacter sp.]
GVHGANRLASNSLTEGLVFGYRAAQVLDEWLSKPLPPLPTNITLPQSWQGDEAILRAIQGTMSEKVGVVRDSDGLRQALKRLAELGERATGLSRAWVTTAWLIAMAALTREESRGAHFRRDFPQADDTRWRGRLIWQFQGDAVWRKPPLKRFLAISSSLPSTAQKGHGGGCL